MSTQNQNQTQDKYDLYATDSADAKPVGVVFKIAITDLENYIIKYLTNNGITGIAHVEIQVEERSGRVAVYLFLSSRSNALVKPTSNVPKRLAHRVSSHEPYITKDSDDVIREIETYEQKRGMDYSVGAYFIRLDVFLCLAKMVCAEPAVHDLRLLEVGREGKGYVMAVSKQDKTAIDRKNDNCDNNKYSRTVSRMERYH